MTFRDIAETLSKFSDAELDSEANFTIDHEWLEGFMNSDAESLILPVEIQEGFITAKNYVLPLLQGTK